MKKDETKNEERNTNEIPQKDQNPEGYDFGGEERKSPCVSEKFTYAVTDEKKQEKRVVSTDDGSVGRAAGL